METDSSKKSGDSTHSGSYNLTIHNLSYKVLTKSGKKTEEKVLLNNVNAHAKHGEIMAVVGPSGAGKSTFLDAVAGRIDPKSLDGLILVNGKEMEAGFKRLSGYVMQDDALFPLLTVKETFLFSARLRLPGTMSHAEKTERANMLIKELGLTTCANTVIGNEEVRGVSGGERRRVSIGVDLIHDPAVLYLDEPTSGLDSTSAVNVMQNLYKIATDRQRTIILTIHQPSFRILDLIHNVLILARGSVVYHGAYTGLADHLAEFGRPAPAHVNTLEFALDVIEACQESEEGLGPLTSFMESKNKVDKSMGSLSSNLGQLADEVSFATSFLSEVAVLSDRNFKNVARTQELFLARIGLMVMTGLTMGSLFFGAQFSPTGVQKRTSYFAFTLALLFFTSTEALPIFLKERQIFIRETSRGAYRTSSYIISNTLVFLPFFFVLAVLNAVAGYFLVGLVRTPSAFFMFVLTLFLVLTLANAYVMFFSALVPNFITGNTIITATTAYFFLFSGFFIKRDNIPDYWIWFHYLSTFKYPMELLLHNEFTNIDECIEWNGAGSCIRDSNQVLSDYSAGKVHVWANILIMLLFIFAYRLFLYIALRIQSKQVRK